MTREDEFEKRLHRCKHFNGLMNRECVMGVEYATVKDANIRPFGYPCFENGATLPCSLREYPTPAELEAEDREIHAALINVVTVRGLIVKQTGGKRNTQGRIDCPICKTGKVSYTVAFNGHIHATCSTEGCVQWIE